MSAPAFPRAAQRIEAAYRQQRLRIRSQVLAAVAAAWARLHADQQQTIQSVTGLVAAGQGAIAQLVDAYLTQSQIAQVGTGTLKGLDPALYTTTVLRRIAAPVIYARPFGAYGAFIAQGADEATAVRAAQASATKLAATDMQLAQTHAARDWMTGDAYIVGWRRTLNPPSCKLCTVAASRTYRISDLMPIHEHCDCGVAPLYGHEPVASVGTTVRIDEDPEIGPRLMADNWSNVGPRLIDKPLA